MDGIKIDLLKKTTQFLVNKLAEDEVHRLGIVTYSDNVQELVELQTISPSNAIPINNAISGVLAAGRTFLSGGLESGIRQQVGSVGGAVKTVYLFTDGLPNLGATTAEDVVGEMRALIATSEEPITVSTFGFGQDLDIKLLKDVADAGGGEAYIITNENDIPIAFGDALGGLLSIVAQDIDVVFIPKGGTTITSIQTGGVITDVPGGIRVSFSNLFANERRDMVLTLSVPAEITTVMDAEVQYIDTLSFSPVTKETISVTIDRAATVPVDAPPDPLVEGTRLKFATAEAIAEAQASVQQGDTAGAATAIASAQAIVNISPVEDDPTIKALQADIAKILDLLESGETTPQEATTQLDTLGEALTKQRSSSLGGDEFETTESLDTPAKKGVREESAEAVLNKPPLPIPEPGTTPTTVPVIDPIDEGPTDPTDPTDPNEPIDSIAPIEAPESSGIGVVPLETDTEEEPPAVVIAEREIPTPEPKEEEEEIPTPEPSEIPAPEFSETPTPEFSETPAAEPSEIPAAEPPAVVIAVREIPMPEPNEEEEEIPAPEFSEILAPGPEEEEEAPLPEPEEEKELPAPAPADTDIFRVAGEDDNPSADVFAEAPQFFG